jgi:hypothetical protein
MWEKYIFSEFDLVTPFTFTCANENIGNNNKIKKKRFI